MAEQQPVAPKSVVGYIESKLSQRPYLTVEELVKCLRANKIDKTITKEEVWSILHDLKFAKWRIDLIKNYEDRIQQEKEARIKAALTGKKKYKAQK